MLPIPKPLILASSLCVASLSLSTNALAVGGGIQFFVNEVQVPNALAHAFQADSMDLTYHACTKVNFLTGALEEIGYFWVSSYQDVDSVVDSQINDFQANGYHIYGKYSFSADRVGIHQDFLSPRADYAAESASISLYLDPDQNTQLMINDCQFASSNTDDDRRIGYSNTLVPQGVGNPGEKSEKVFPANGDFELRFTNWIWINPAPITPFASDRFIFNANVTLLGGPLLLNHNPEGSGNVYWLGD